MAASGYPGQGVSELSVSAEQNGTVRWGMLGTGNICNDFAVALSINGSTLQAVAASDEERARAFAARFGVQTVHASYTALLSDPNVDVVYVGSRHTSHYEHVKLVLNAGKPCLVEKPMCMSEHQASELSALAQEKNLFLMEGMWTRCFPVVKRVRDVLASGELGVVCGVQGDSGFPGQVNDGAWRWDLTQGGGAMLDMGPYVVQLALMAFGPNAPDRIASAAYITNGGVDANGSCSLSWNGKGTASLMFSMHSSHPEEFKILCERGFITIHFPAHCPTSATITRCTSRTNWEREPILVELPKLPDGLSINFPHSEGLVYEVQTVERCLKAGDKEAVEWPMSEALINAHIRDEFFKQVGISYPSSITAV